MDLPELKENTEYLFRIALSKCGNFHDAEDLAQEVILAALQSSAEVQDVKAWLGAVLNHKYHDMLRKKYKLPTVSIDMVPEEAEPYEQEEINDRPDAAEVRREVAYLSEKCRRVIVRHYLDGEKVETIAKEMGLPKGTVLSRLSYGREQMRKGFDMIASYEEQSYRPERLDVSCHGEPGLHGEPWSLVSGDLMKQNILIVAYEKPRKVVEIAKALGIPTAYVEYAVRELVSCELMRRVGDRYHTDFLIVTPEALCHGVDAEIEAVEVHYEELLAQVNAFWSELRQVPIPCELSEGKRQKLDYYFLLHLLSGAIYTATQTLIPANEEYPVRPDGGRWIAKGIRYPQNFDFASVNFSKYTYGGERRAYRENFCNARSIELRIYDMQPDLNRYERGPVEMQDAELASLLYILWRGIPFEATGFDPIFCENIPHLTDCGVLDRKDGCPIVNVPVLTPNEYRALDQIRLRYMRQLTELLLPILRELLPKVKIELPQQLVGRVAAFRQYSCYAIPMAFVKSASVKGDLSTMDALPPMVFVVDDDR